MLSNTQDSSGSPLPDNTLHTLIKRCVQCPQVALSCPPCKSDEVCSQIAQSCNECASTKCVKISDSGTAGPGSTRRETNVGALAGGVAGGLAIIGMLVFLVWWFWIRHRKREQEEASAADEDFYQEKTAEDFDSRRDARTSVHTARSRVSRASVGTALTRASNFIQIAYIPGVTNRSGPGETHTPTTDALVPPVPAMPGPGTLRGGPASQQEQHFFLPDLRDSTFSGFSGFSVQESQMRQSIAPSLARSSMATTIYRDNAVLNPAPAQTIVRGKAAVVSVKTSPNNNLEESGGRAAALATSK